MQIAVLGATGRTGQQVVQEALERGYNIKALVRNPGIFKFLDEKLTVEKVNLFNDDELSEHLRDCDAVVSCIGARTKIPVCRRMAFYEDSMKSIVGAMRKANTKRLVCMSAWCAKSVPKGIKFVEWCIRPFIMGNYLRSMADMEDYLETDCSDIEYTAVRPPILTNGPSTGKKLRVEDNQFITGMGTFPSVTRRDIAKFMLDCIEGGEWKQKCVAVGMEIK